LEGSVALMGLVLQIEARGFSLCARFNVLELVFAEWLAGVKHDESRLVTSLFL